MDCTLWDQSTGRAITICNNRVTRIDHPTSRRSHSESHSDPLAPAPVSLPPAARTILGEIVELLANQGLVMNLPQSTESTGRTAPDPPLTQPTADMPEPLIAPTMDFGHREPAIYPSGGMALNGVEPLMAPVMNFEEPNAPPSNTSSPTDLPEPLVAPSLW